MRSSFLLCAGLLSAFVATEAGAAQRTKSARTVQVIAMGEAPVPKKMAEVPELPAPPDDRQIAAVFRTYDLSRRWVAFEMANSFAASGAAALDGGSTDPGLTVSPPLRSLPPFIAIPDWMRGKPALSVAATSFAPGCGAGIYRPSGFLKADAEYRRQAYYGMMSSIACQYGIPVGLFDAMIIRESRYRADISSPKDAFGLTQLMPDTAARLGVNRYDVEQNLRGGALYLRRQLDRFGQVHLALAAYNAGPGRVRNGLIPKIVETQSYVDNVLLNWQRLAGLGAAGSVPTATIAPSRARARRPFLVARTATVASY